MINWILSLGTGFACFWGHCPEKLNFNPGDCISSDISSPAGELVLKKSEDQLNYTTVKYTLDSKSEKYGFFYDIQTEDKSGFKKIKCQEAKIFVVNQKEKYHFVNLEASFPLNYLPIMFPLSTTKSGSCLKKKDQLEENFFVIKKNKNTALALNYNSFNEELNVMNLKSLQKIVINNNFIHVSCQTPKIENSLILTLKKQNLLEEYLKAIGIKKDDLFSYTNEKNELVFVVGGKESFATIVSEPGLPGRKGGLADLPIKSPTEMAGDVLACMFLGCRTSWYKDESVSF